MRIAFWGGMFGGNNRRDNRDSNDNSFALVSLAIGIVASIIAFLIGPLIQAAVSRQREYLADATGAEITRYPEGLASALEKLGQYGRPMKRASSSMAHLYIADPIKPGMVERAFSTHPPIADRIARLKKIGAGF
jgi:heat shock protein HtpX